MNAAAALAQTAWAPPRSPVVSMGNPEQQQQQQQEQQYRGQKWQQQQTGGMPLAPGQVIPSFRPSPEYHQQRLHPTHHQQQQQQQQEQKGWLPQQQQQEDGQGQQQQQDGLEKLFPRTPLYPHPNRTHHNHHQQQQQPQGEQVSAQHQQEHQLTPHSPKLTSCSRFGPIQEVQSWATQAAELRQRHAPDVAQLLRPMLQPPGQLTAATAQQLLQPLGQLARYGWLTGWAASLEGQQQLLEVILVATGLRDGSSSSVSSSRRSAQDVAATEDAATATEGAFGDTSFNSSSSSRGNAVGSSSSSGEVGPWGADTSSAAASNGVKQQACNNSRSRTTTAAAAINSAVAVEGEAYATTPAQPEAAAVEPSPREAEAAAAGESAAIIDSVGSLAGSIGVDVWRLLAHEPRLIEQLLRLDDINSGSSSISISSWSVPASPPSVPPSSSRAAAAAASAGVAATEAVAGLGTGSLSRWLSQSLDGSIPHLEHTTLLQLIHAWGRLRQQGWLQIQPALEEQSQMALSTGISSRVADTWDTSVTGASDAGDTGITRAGDTRHSSRKSRGSSGCGIGESSSSSVGEAAGSSSSSSKGSSGVSGSSETKSSSSSSEPVRGGRWRGVTWWKERKERKKRLAAAAAAGEQEQLHLEHQKGVALGQQREGPGGEGHTATQGKQQQQESLLGFSPESGQLGAGEGLDGSGDHHHHHHQQQEELGLQQQGVSELQCSPLGEGGGLASPNQPQQQQAACTELESYSSSSSSRGGLGSGSSSSSNMRGGVDIGHSTNNSSSNRGDNFSTLSMANGNNSTTALISINGSSSSSSPTDSILAGRSSTLLHMQPRLMVVRSDQVGQLLLCTFKQLGRFASHDQQLQLLLAVHNLLFPFTPAAAIPGAGAVWSRGIVKQAAAASGASGGGGAAPVHRDGWGAVTSDTGDAGAARSRDNGPAPDGHGAFDYGTAAAAAGGGGAESARKQQQQQQAVEVSPIVADVIARIRPSAVAETYLPMLRFRVLQELKRLEGLHPDFQLWVRSLARMKQRKQEEGRKRRKEEEQQRAQEERQKAEVGKLADLVGELYHVALKLGRHSSSSSSSGRDRSSSGSSGSGSSKSSSSSGRDRSSSSSSKSSSSSSSSGRGSSTNANQQGNGANQIQGTSSRARPVLSGPVPSADEVTAVLRRLQYRLHHLPAAEMSYLAQGLAVLAEVRSPCLGFADPGQQKGVEGVMPRGGYLAGRGMGMAEDRGGGGGWGLTLHESAGGDELLGGGVEGGRDVGGAAESGGRQQKQDQQELKARSEQQQKGEGGRGYHQQQQGQVQTGPNQQQGAKQQQERQQQQQQEAKQQQQGAKWQQQQLLLDPPPVLMTLAGSFMDRLAGAAATKLEEFRTTHLVRLLWAFAQLKYR